MDSSKRKRLDETSNIINNLYQKRWFTDLSSEERVKKISEILINVTAVNEISESIDELRRYNDAENRRDSPHHYDNRLD